MPPISDPSRCPGGWAVLADAVSAGGDVNVCPMYESVSY